MSINILQEPDASLSADNALFVVASTASGSANFRYVADVSGSTLLARLKCDKLPNNEGFFNVTRVIETLVPITKPAVTFYQDALIASAYQVGFKEEFGTPPVIATGSTVASGIVFQGYKRQWEDFVSSGYYTLGSTAKILSKQPTKRKIRVGENDFVSILTHLDLSAAKDWITYIFFKNRTFSVTSGILDLQLDAMFNLGLAGIYSLTSGETSDSRAGSFRNPLWTNALEFAAYNARATADGAVSDSNACAFDIFDGLVDFDGGGTYKVEIIYLHNDNTPYYSEDRTTENYTVEYEVETCERFVPQRLFFKNSLGGFDGYTFTMKNRKVGNMSNQTFGKNQNIFGTKVAETIYSGEFEETMTLNSDWLLNANWMSELIYSPQVYLQIGSELVEAIVNTSTFQFHTRPQDKLQQLQLEIKIAYKNNII